MVLASEDEGLRKSSTSVLPMTEHNEDDRKHLGVAHKSEPRNMDPLPVVMGLDYDYVLQLEDYA